MISRRGLAQVLDERRRHPHRRRPGAVGRADRLDHFLEDGRAAQHPARSLRGPGELRVVRGCFVEAGQVLVQVEDASQNSVQPLLRLASELGSKDLDACRPLPFAHDDRARFHAGDGKRRRERPLLLVHAHRRQVGHAVRHQRPPEVDRLSRGACKRDRELHGENLPRLEGLAPRPFVRSDSERGSKAVPDPGTSMKQEMGTAAIHLDFIASPLGTRLP